MQVIQILTTVGGREEAEKIAWALVQRRLAACVQVLGPISSTYRWQGAIETSQEWLCVVKTRSDCYEQVEAAIRELHPYETPEILATPIVAGSKDYLAWLAEQVDPPAR